MTERKLTDEQIIEALKRCRDASETQLIKATLDLINRQIAEIENLEAETRGFSICLDSAVKTALKIKCETIRGFDEKFKRASDLICTGSLGSGAADIKNYYRISFDSYEKLIQEMTEKAAHDD